jgi:mono/diheme cytochrome c family protein
VASRFPTCVFLLLGAVAACGGGKGGGAGSVPASGGAATSTAAATGDPRGALFVQKGCPQCHSISALGIKSQNEVGPDLTEAYEDVQHRFGIKLEEFLPNPTGTMQMVLSQMIHLSPVERDSIIHVLKRLHDEHEAGETH